MGRCLVTKDTDRSAIPMALVRRLQVELAHDPNDVDKSDPNDDRVGILVKTGLQKNSPDRQYLECKRDAILLGLLTEESVKKIKAREDESRDGPITRNDLLHGIHEIKEAVHEEGYRIRQHIDMKFTDLLHEIQHKHGVLVRHIQDLNTFAMEEKERSVPRSLQVAMIVGKTLGNIYLPGLFSFIPDFLQGGGDGLSKAVDRAAPMLLEEDESIHQVQEGHVNYGTKTGPVDLKERTIAEAVVKDLKDELGEATFKDKTGLRKVVLEATAPPHIGSSMQASSSQPQISVRWICDRCYRSYGERARAIA
ncbi:unnamed protein product [Calypogeia fissa]